MADVKPNESLLLLDVQVEAEFLSAVVQGHQSIDRDVLPYVEPDYFSVEAYKWLVKVLKDREWKAPAYNFIDQLVLGVEDLETRKVYKTQIQLLYTRQLTFPEDASIRFRAFVADRVTNLAIKGAYEAYGRSQRIDFLLKDVKEGVSRAQHIIEGNKLPVWDYAGDYENRQEKRKLDRDNPSQNPRILTGILGLDQQFTIKAPMIVDFLAPFKRYKSILLNSMGFAALLQGFNVACVVFENTYAITADRFDALFSQLDYSRVSNLLLTDEEKLFMDQQFEWMRSWESRLKIIKCIPEETKVSEVEDALDRLYDSEGFRPDVEIWDYLNIVAPSKTVREDHKNQTKVVWDLQKHAIKYEAAIFTASQAKQEGIRAERLQQDHRGKSIGISQALDLSIAIDQNEHEKRDGIIVLSPMFSRAFPIKIPEIVLESDLAKMIIAKEVPRLWQHAARINPYKGS